MEKRQFARLSMHSDTDITCNNSIIGGSALNISMKGAFVRTDAQLPEGATVEVTIYTSSTSNQLCDLRAKVVRSSEYGVGLEFEKTVLD